IITLLLISSKVGYAQELIIGQILNEKTYQPVNKVYIEIEGSNSKTYSNRAGYFQIQADSGKVLHFKCLGYLDGKLKVPEEKRFKVLLTPSRLDTAEYIGGNGAFLQNMGRFLKYPSD